MSRHPCIICICHCLVHIQSHKFRVVIFSIASFILTKEEKVSNIANRIANRIRMYFSKLTVSAMVALSLLVMPADGLTSNLIDNVNPVPYDLRPNLEFVSCCCCCCCYY
jgi:hypothetical protein